MTTTAKSISKGVEPSNYPKRIDFKLAPFMASDDRIASWQILNTVIPIIAVAIAMSAVTTSFNVTAIVLTPLLLVLMVLLLSRSFSLMHDCGHQSLFSSKRSNRIAAFGLSLIHGMPQHPWSRGHAFHHKHNGELGPLSRTICSDHTRAIRLTISTLSVALSPLAPSTAALPWWILLSHHQAKSCLTFKLL